MDFGEELEFSYNETDPFTDSPFNTTSFRYAGNRSAAAYRRPNQPHIKYITLAFYMGTFVFGLIGNTLVLYVIARFQKIRKRSVANYYIWNLALADELYIFALPWFCFATYTSDWIFGDAVCKVLFVIRECNKFASVFTLMALSIDRYLATYHNLGRLRTIRVGKLVCLAIWVSCLVSCTPYLMYSYTIKRGGRHSCQLNWPAENLLFMRRAWTYTQLVIGYLLPLCVIVTSNCLLLWRLKTLVRPGAGGGGSGKGKKSRSNTGMMKTVLVVVVTFMLCQAPYHVVEVLSLRILERSITHKVVPTASETIIFVNFNMVVQILVFLSSCCNPIIYGVCNRNFRNLYKQVLCCGFLQHKSGPDGRREYLKLNVCPSGDPLRCCANGGRRGRHHQLAATETTAANGLMEIQATAATDLEPSNKNSSVSI